jgi:electron-transferring-flavoprotein dehydrogenase
MADDVEREAMEYDVVIVGGGPGGLCAAIRLKQLAEKAGTELSVALLEKGSEIGAHILSGAVMDPIALRELYPNFDELDHPLDTPVTKDKLIYLGPQGEMDISWLPTPKYMNNHGCYVGSLANLCRWLAVQAEEAGVEIYPGFACSDVVYAEDGRVKGVVAGVVGISKEGEEKGDYSPGVELHGKYVLIAEGVRGSLAKQIQAKFGLADKADVQKYGIGIKELWQVPDDKFDKGLVHHSMGWPLDEKTAGGSWMYHFGDNYVSVGYVVHLNYKNPWLSPFDEFQRWKQHPSIRQYLEGGKRVAYGARAISAGGWQSVPKLSFPGGVLIGDSAGFLNYARIKGTHTAAKSGMLAAETVFAALQAGREGADLVEYQRAYEKSWIFKELKQVRNVKPLITKFGRSLGTVISGIDMWMVYLLRGFSPWGTLKHGKTDAESTELAAKHKPIEYPKYDGVISFDKLSSVYLSNTNHEEDQPAHLRLKDPSIPIQVNLPKYGEPARLYCPASVYEVVYDEQKQNPKFVINAQNCVHCKTCDIKDPSQNIVWTTPEGGGGPNYPNM